MPKAVRRGEQRQIENPPAHRACLRRAMDLFLRTIGIARATTKIGLANLVYNISSECREIRGAGIGIIGDASIASGATVSASV